MSERMEPEQQDFEPEDFDAEAGDLALDRGVRLFNEGEYHAAHEEFEKCWLKNEAADADFFKGLIQAAICMHHFQRANLDGARKLYSGHRRLLGAYLPTHRKIDVAALVSAMQACLRPVLRAAAGETVELDRATSPRIDLDAGADEEN
ncbi:MAG: putative metal-dependent hydrolase [Planctomycetota bacterium]|jgi:predicted metal-dependent hydrolase